MTTLQNLVLYYPQIAFTLSMLGLVIITLSWRSPTPFIKGCMLFCLLPVLPIIIVRCLAVWTVDLCDWLTVGRRWCQPSVMAAHWFEGRLR